MNEIQIISDSAEKTFEIGHKIGSVLRGGNVVCLTGSLGSGKTTLVKGIALGAGAAEPKLVNSPTFVIINEYHGRFNIFHIDAYRINTIAEFESLGFEDILGPDSVVIIEWADKVSSWLDGIDCIHIEMKHNGPNSRTIRLSGLNSLDSL